MSGKMPGLIYSPDFNLIEQIFSRIKIFLHKAAERSSDALQAAIDRIIETIWPQEYRSCFTNSGRDTQQIREQLKAAGLPADDDSVIRYRGKYGSEFYKRWDHLPDFDDPDCCIVKRKPTEY